MLSLRKSLQLLMIISCIFIAGASCTQADEEKKSPVTSSSNTNSMMNPMMMGQMNGMMNPHMYMNMMAQMSGMMNPMMMGGGMMNPNGNEYDVPNDGTDVRRHGYARYGCAWWRLPDGTNARWSNDGSQTAYEQWFNQWTEMMKNMAAQQQTTQ